MKTPFCEGPHDFPTTGVPNRMLFIRQLGEVQFTQCNNCLAVEIRQRWADGEDGDYSLIFTVLDEKPINEEERKITNGKQI